MAFWQCRTAFMGLKWPLSASVRSRWDFAASTLPRRLMERALKSNERVLRSFPRFWSFAAKPSSSPFIAQIVIRFATGLEKCTECSAIKRAGRFVRGWLRNCISNGRGENRYGIGFSNHVGKLGNRWCESFVHLRRKDIARRALSCWLRLKRAVPGADYRIPDLAFIHAGFKSTSTVPHLTLLTVLTDSQSPSRCAGALPRLLLKTSSDATSTWEIYG
jgi:hypothetical protein